MMGWLFTIFVLLVGYLVFVVLPIKLAAKWLRAERSTWAWCFLASILATIAGMVAQYLIVNMLASVFGLLTGLVALVFAILAGSYAYSFVLDTGLWRGVGIYILSSVLSFILGLVLFGILFFVGLAPRMGAMVDQLRANVPGQLGGVVAVEHLDMAARAVCDCQEHPPCLQQMIPQWNSLVMQARPSEFGAHEQERYRHLLKEVAQCAKTAPPSAVALPALPRAPQSKPSAQTSAPQLSTEPTQSMHGPQPPAPTKPQYVYQSKKRGELASFKGYPVKITLKDGRVKQGQLESSNETGISLRQHAHGGSITTQIPWESLQDVAVWVRSE